MGGLTFLFALIPTLFFDFIGSQDITLEQNGWPVQALQSDRAGLLSADSWRSFVFITITFGILWMHLKSKLKTRT